MAVTAPYDVVVVGAGCAGPAAARTAASLGLRTILIEKAREARDFLELLRPYRTIGSDFDEIHAARRLR
jgi:NADPH-dependent 2,4-dienoyl-CoA reductase/sulfur reductase-like enzyme